jgi:hypothetical protein
MKIQRLGQMELESSFTTESGILFRPKTSESYRAYPRLRLSGLREQGVAASIWKTDVTNQDIDFRRAHRLNGLSGRGGCQDFVSDMPEQISQYPAGVVVIFDDQYPQALCRN